MRREPRHDIGVGNQGHIVGGPPVKAKSLEVGPTGLEGDDFLCRRLGLLEARERRGRVATDPVAAAMSSH